MNLDELLNEVLNISRAAGDEILKVYNDASGIDVETKSDSSPVTQADLKANALIVERLEALDPKYPVLTEESNMADFEIRKNWSRYWIVDPLDGTKEFINRNGEFTVNIALIENHQPILGVVYVPVQDTAYLGLVGEKAEKISGDQREVIACRKLKSVLPVVEIVASKNHLNADTEQFIAAVQSAYGEIDSKSIGSSLKFCLLAEGSADVYPRFAPTSEWDTAAAQAVLQAAGGQVYKQDLTPLDYNAKENILNPYFFAVADTSVDWKTVLQQTSV
ncbi:MAG: 3'(2'),5'-bisphosphate nucleotidase CysQ [Agarilytica sp.]